MAAPLPIAELLSASSIQHDSEELAIRIGERRRHIADLRERVLLSDLSFATKARLVRVYDVMIREAAR